MRDPDARWARPTHMRTTTAATAALLIILLGACGDPDGDARGIALVFMIAGAIMFVTVLIALTSAPYRRLSAAYADAPPQQIEGAATD